MKTVYIYLSSHNIILKHKKNRLLFLFLLAQIAAAAQLPEYHVKMLTDQQGLNTSDILAMSKDKKGFLWLLSQSSVQRYDGRQAKQFSFTETLANIFVDAQDRKWIIGRKGIYLFKNDHDGFTEIRVTKTGKKSPVCLYNDDGGLYLLLSDSVMAYNESSGKFVQSTGMLSFPKPLTGLSSKTANILFVSSGDSIYRADLLAKTISSMAFRSASAMLAVSDNELLLSDWDSRSYSIDFSTKQTKEIFPKDVDASSKNEFLRFFEGVPLTGHRFFLSSNLGVVEYDQSTHNFHLPVIYNKGRLLYNNASIKNFYEDNEGTLFMSHADGVAFINLNNPSIHYIRDYTDGKETLPDIDVRCFAEDKAGNTWIGTVNGIARLNMKTGAVKSFLPSKTSGINFPSIRHLLFIDDYLWAGTGGKGLWLLNTVTNKFRRPVFSKDSTGKKTEQFLNEDFIWKMVELQNGNVFVAGGSHLYLINNKSLQVTILNLPAASGVSRSAIQDRQGRTWHGTTNGLSCYDENMHFLFSIRDSFPDKRIAALCEWKKDRMLVGSKGLYEVEVSNNTIAAFRKLNALPESRFIYCMQQDTNGDVWIGTDEGLFRYDPVIGACELFDAADNIQPQAFNTNGLFLSKNNRILAGGKTGFNYFDPSTMQKKQSLPRPWIASFSIGNNDSLFFKTPGPYRADYFNRSIVINISAPEYQRPFALQYRYRLNAKENTWIPNGNSSTVRMNNLPPGDYNFEASVSYDGRTWISTSQIIPFTVLRPWWQQWWFRLLVIACITGIFIAIAVYRNRQRVNEEHQRTIDYFANSGHEYSSTDDILWDITRNCISRLGFEDCVIYLLDEDREVLRQRAAYGAKSPRSYEILNPIEIPVGKGITGYVAASGIAEIVHDTSRDKRYVVDDEVRLSEIVVPIIHNEKLIGVIDSEHRQKGFFTKKHLETLQTIASICAAKISLGIAMEKMQHAIQHVEEVNNKMAETKFINLRLQMNPHFLFNSLSSIQHLIVSKQTNEAYKYLSVFSSFLRSILQYADKTVITLDDELKMLGMYIKLESLGFDETFSYTIKVDEELETEDVFIPPLIIQPLIENAIWHGLLHKEGKKFFTVQFINNTDDNLLCIVEDNGIGRDKAATIKQKNLNSFAYESKATSLIKERLLLLQQKTGKEASLATEDILDKGSITGTRVKIIIPYYNNDEV